MLKIQNIFMKRHYSGSGLKNYVKKSIYISQSNNIYSNLALEDWLYRYFDFTNHHILMLWQSDPCIVIGKHQNPWIEANIPALPNITKNGVKLARRNSGGGTVYHDMGNLNLSFFCPKERYNRKYNLEIITRAIQSRFRLNVDISPREDLTLNGYKISGTAAKLGRPNSYHHCTLLVNSKKSDISEALRKQSDLEITTHATRSIPSPVTNLSEALPNISIEGLIDAVAREYLKTSIVKDDEDSVDYLNQANDYQLINPSEEAFPGLLKLQEELSTWNWCYGKTPKFTVVRNYRGGLRIHAVVEKGCIEDVTVSIPHDFFDLDIMGDFKIVTGEEGCVYTSDFMDKLEKLIVSDEFSSKNEDKSVVGCLRDAILIGEANFKENTRL